MDTEQKPNCLCGCGASVRSKKARWIKGHANRGRVFRSWGEREYEIEVNGCWRWRGRFDDKGYGRTSQRIGKNQIKAHVFYYVKAHGPVPEAKELDHKCRNRWCVNPEHLEPVTHLVNMTRGANTKYSDDFIREMRRRLEAGESKADLARSLGIPYSTVSNAYHNRPYVE